MSSKEEEEVLELYETDEEFARMFDAREDWQRDYDHACSCMLVEEVDSDLK